MFLQVFGLVIGFITHITRMEFLARVNSHVAVENGRLRKLHEAHSTRVRLVMHAHMYRQFAFACESLLTMFAGVRFFTIMSSHVHFESLFLGEAFVAEFAGPHGFLFARVDELMVE